MAWQDPLERESRQPSQRLDLARPRIPAVVGKCLELPAVTVPRQMVAGEQKAILKQQDAMPRRVARSWHGQELGGQRQRFLTLQDDLGVRLSMQFGTMD